MAATLDDFWPNDSFEIQIKLVDHRFCDVMWLKNSVTQFLLRCKEGSAIRCFAGQTVTMELEVMDSRLTNFGGVARGA